MTFINNVWSKVLNNLIKSADGQVIYSNIDKKTKQFSSHTQILIIT